MRGGDGRAGATSHAHQQTLVGVLAPDGALLVLEDSQEATSDVAPSSSFTSGSFFNSGRAEPNGLNGGFKRFVHVAGTSPLPSHTVPVV